ncbi:MAG: archaellin/type IV pilin N-terminal domain-containing protein [Nitrososphaeria archaeon]
MKRGKGVSPVVATVILIAITVAIAIAVAFWAAGLTGAFTRFERVEIVNAYTAKGSGYTWTIYVYIKNTGSADSTITDIFINGLSLTDAGGTLTGAITTPYVLLAGDSKTLTISLTSAAGRPYISGQTIEVKIHTASGAEYPKSVVLK